MRMKNATVIGLLAVVVALSALQARASAPTKNAPTSLVWLPIHVPVAGEVWYAPKPGTQEPVVSWFYAKPAEQTVFRLVGMFTGDGEVLLAYGGAGDGVEFHFTQPEPMTVDTPVGMGGGTVPIVLDVYIIQRGSMQARVENMNVFAGSER